MLLLIKCSIRNLIEQEGKFTSFVERRLHRLQIGLFAAEKDQRIVQELIELLWMFVEALKFDS